MNIILIMCLLFCCTLYAEEASMPRIIYLNGPSSSGKTTLTKHLQKCFSEPYLHIGIDKIIGFMPEKVNNWWGDPAPEGFSLNPVTDPTGHPAYQIQTGPFAKKITRTLKDFAVLLASQKYNLIIDDVALGSTEVEEWKEALKEYNVLYVGVHAPLEILEERERLRGDRIPGGARGQYFTVHKNVSYDIEIETHTQTLEENADLIRQAMDNKFMSQQSYKPKSDFAVIYRGYVKPEKEADYQNAWQMVAKYFVKHRGAIGSCLHKTSDGMWIAYSRWPDQATRDASWPGENAPSDELPLEIRQAMADIKNSLDMERKLPDICMDVINDLLLER